MSTHDDLHPAEAPQLFRVFQRAGDALREVGLASGRTITEAMRVFDGRSSWSGTRPSPLRFVGCGREYVLEPVFHRRVQTLPPAPRTGNRRYFVTVKELRQRGLIF
ncbi:MAG: hypothetical protein RJA36_3841 [Pseudomonadota bacterium]|jgi:hypothetical protein